jgi:hypothetical protein
MSTSIQLLTHQATCRGGSEGAFIANVIVNWHRKPTTKLRGLVALLEAGHDVRLPEMDLLVVDGNPRPFTFLEGVR